MGERNQYPNEGEVSLAVVEGNLVEINNLGRQFESLNPDKVPAEEQVDLANRYQSIRKPHLELIRVIGNLKISIMPGSLLR